MPIVFFPFFFCLTLNMEKRGFLLEKTIFVCNFVNKKVCILPVIYLCIFIITLKTKKSWDYYKMAPCKCHNMLLDLCREHNNYSYSIFNWFAHTIGLILVSNVCQKIQRHKHLQGLRASTSFHLQTVGCRLFFF